MSDQLVLKLRSRPVLPRAYALHPPSPNPFNARTAIQYDLPEAGEVRLVLYDTLGRVLRRLVVGRTEGGVHRAIWDGRDEAGRPVASGVVWCRLEVRTMHGRRTYVETRKVLLLR